MYNNYNIDRLTRQKEEIENMINTYKNMQTNPINNFINTGQQMQNNMYELKKLNDGEEVENIMVARDTIFIGLDRLQIKKIDGTIEKYSITKTFPIDPKDEQIKALNEKVEELERKLNNEHTKYDKSTSKSDKSSTNVDGDVKSKSNATSKSI